MAFYVSQSVYDIIGLRFEHLPSSTSMFLGQLQPWKLVEPKMSWNVEFSCLFAIADNYSREQLPYTCMYDWHTYVDDAIRAKYACNKNALSWNSPAYLFSCNMIVYWLCIPYLGIAVQKSVVVMIFTAHLVFFIFLQADIDLILSELNSQAMYSCIVCIVNNHWL